MAVSEHAQQCSLGAIGGDKKQRSGDSWTLVDPHTNMGSLTLAVMVTKCVCGRGESLLRSIIRPCLWPQALQNRNVSSGPRPCRMSSIYEDTAAADLLQLFRKLW